MQSVLAQLIRAYVEMTIATLRWTTEDGGNAETALRGQEGFIALFWHGRIAQAMACRRLLGDKPRAVMVSLSRDGEFIAKAAEQLGFPTIRGSKGRANMSVDKGGAAAFRAAFSTIKTGGVMLLTPDGPQGPREVVQVGPVQLARAARCQVFLLGLAARPSLSLRSWDQGKLPLPFARAALWVEGPETAPTSSNSTVLETTRKLWQDGMVRAQDRAEALLSR